MEHDFREGPLADKEKIRKKGLQERIGRRQELGDIQILLSTRSGRRFFNRLLVAGHMFAPTFTGNNSTFYRDGQREVMLPFLGDAQNFPELYLLMLKESKEEPEADLKEDGPSMMETVPRDEQGTD